jgi:hypothetical protein
VAISETPNWSTPATLNEIVQASTVGINLEAGSPISSPITYSQISGSLPSGLTLNSSTGLLSGTVAGGSGYNSAGVVSTFTVRATDGTTPIDRTFNITKKWLDGTTAALAIPTTLTVTSQVALTGQTTGDIWIKDKSGDNILTKLYVNAGAAYVLIAGISSSTTHGQFTGGRGNWSGQWTNRITTFGNRNTANSVDGYKNELYWDYDYDDLLIMQGFTKDPISSDYYANSTEVAFTNTTFMIGRGRNMANMLSGAGAGPDLRTQGAGGRFQVGVTFLKGTAAASEARYRSNAISELNPSNQLDFGIGNNEGRRFAMVNALGCRTDGANSEHYSWVADVDNNYSQLNYPEPNWDGTWGINAPNNWLYWLFWARA